MWGWRSSRTVVIGLAAALFVVSCVLPVASFLMTSLRGATAAFALDARQWGLLVNTAGLGVGSAVLATAIGAPLGLLLARASLPYRALLRVALAAPLLLPPYVVALAWTYLASSRGLLAAVVGYDALAAWTYSLPAAALVLGLVLYPLSMLATEVALRRIDGRLEEAALMVAGPRARVLAHHGAPRGPGHHGRRVGDLRPGRIRVWRAGRPAGPCVHDRDLHGLRRALRPRSGSAPGPAPAGPVPRRRGRGRRAPRRSLRERSPRRGHTGRAASRTLALSSRR